MTLPAKTKTAMFRATKAEKQRWQAAADRAGVKLSEWIRRTCNDPAPTTAAGEWRTIIHWLNINTGESGVLDDTAELPHRVLLELIRDGARLKINGCQAIGGSRPLVDLIAKTLEYSIELFPL